MWMEKEHSDYYWNKLRLILEFFLKLQGSGHEP